MLKEPLCKRYYIVLMAIYYTDILIDFDGNLSDLIISFKTWRFAHSWHW